MLIAIPKRSYKPEIMDDFELQGDELQLVMNDLQTVNRLLGGNKITLEGIQVLTRKLPKEQEISIIDIGCGDGEILRKCADFAKKNQLNWKLTGIDANEHIIEKAKSVSGDFPEIEFIHQNIFSEEFKSHNPHIFLCTLTLHHFNNEEIRDFLVNLVQRAKVGIVINDLHRSALTYHLFKIFSFFFIKSKIAREDGLTSILRSFKKRELKKFASNFKTHKHTITWKWAFRYQWIIEKK